MLEQRTLTAVRKWWSMGVDDYSCGGTQVKTSVGLQGGDCWFNSLVILLLGDELIHG